MKRKIKIMFYMFDNWVATRIFNTMAAANAYINANPEGLAFDEWRAV